MQKKAAFIGTGNMGGALAKAACRGLGGAQVVVADYQPEKAAVFARETGCAAVGSNAEAARSADYVFLCVKPQVLEPVAREIGGILKETGGAAVSIAAGVPTSRISTWLGGDVPVLRVMPNTCASIGQGMLALTAAQGVAETHLAGVEEILQAAGRVERIAEGLMDQFTAIAGCGPAYVYLLIEALADGGVMIGLSRAQAQIYAAQTVLGAAAMVLESGQHPGALKDAVCSPGGATIAGVAELERSGFRAAAIDAVLAAYEKSVDIGRDA
ncbi:MAG: pyrroline-5-carboxylate reductase [Oscillospiraceae bacterium]|nr:pyrroline-5-carboxylate reductase [Oscillospiraceae bacterium]